MAGGPSADVKRESSARDTSHLIEESWRHLIVNLVIVALVAATVWVLVSGVRWTIEEGSGYLFAPFDAAAEGAGPALDGDGITAAWILFAVVVAGGFTRGLIIQIPSWRSSEGDGMATSLEHFHATYDHPEAGHQPRYDRPDFLQAVRRAVMTSLTVGTGGSGGIEAPVVPLGECIGAGWARLLRVPLPDDLRILQMAGISAAVVTLLDAPFTVALFAAEIVYTDRVLYRTLMYSLFAAVIAYALNNHVLDVQPLFTATGHVYVYSPLEYLEVAAIALICSAPAGLGVNFLFVHIKTLMLAIPSLFRGAVSGALVGAIGLGLWFGLGLEPRHVMGVSEETIMEIVSGEGNPLLEVWWVLVLLVVLKAVATGLTLGAGGSAGALVPAMFLGGVSGAAVYHFLGGIGYATAGDPSLYVAAGIAAGLVAVVQVPLAAIAFVMEVFGATYGPPAIVSCFLTYMIVKRLRLYAEPRKRAAEAAAEADAPTATNGT